MPWAYVGHMDTSFLHNLPKAEQRRIALQVGRVDRYWLGYALTSHETIETFAPAIVSPETKARAIVSRINEYVRTQIITSVMMKKLITNCDGLFHILQNGRKKSPKSRVA